MSERYIVEVRNEKGELDFEKEKQVQRRHPFLALRQTFSMDELCWYASYGQGRNKPMGPMEIGEFYKSIGVSYRCKTW
jgi:hypothetical protein